MNGPTSGPALSGLVASTARPNEDVRILQAGTPASDDRRRPTPRRRRRSSIAGPPLAPGGGQTDYQTAQYAKRLKAWQAKRAAEVQAEAAQTRADVSAWLAGLGIPQKLSRLADPPADQGSLAAESAGRGQRAGGPGGGGRQHLRAPPGHRPVLRRPERRASGRRADRGRRHRRDQLSPDRGGGQRGPGRPAGGRGGPGRRGGAGGDRRPARRAGLGRPERARAERFGLGAGAVRQRQLRARPGRGRSAQAAAAAAAEAGSDRGDQRVRVDAGHRWANYILSYRASDGGCPLAGGQRTFRSPR